MRRERAFPVWARTTADWRGPLAVMCLAGAGTYALTALLLTGRPAELPGWMISVVSLVVGHYFGAKNEVTKRDEARDAGHDRLAPDPAEGGPSIR